MPAFPFNARRIVQLLPGLFLFAILATGATRAGADAERLRAKHAELQAQLASSPFQRPIYMDSSESPSRVSGSIYAVIEQP